MSKQATDIQTCASIPHKKTLTSVQHVNKRYLYAPRALPTGSLQLILLVTVKKAILAVAFVGEVVLVGDVSGDEI